MTTVVEVLDIATEDSTPTEAPYRIGPNPAKDSLTFKVKVTASGIIRAIRVRFKPLNRNSGQLLYRRGMVCGSGDRCGTPEARTLVHTSPMTTDTIELDEADIAAEADGEYDVAAFALSDDGWSS